MQLSFSVGSIKNVLLAFLVKQNKIYVQSQCTDLALFNRLYTLVTGHYNIYSKIDFSVTLSMLYFFFLLLIYLFILMFIYFFSIYEIYCQNGFHTTPSAHPKRCPPQYPVCSQFLRVSYALALSHSNLFFFFFLPLPHGLEQCFLKEK